MWHLNCVTPPLLRVPQVRKERVWRASHSHREISFVPSVLTYIALPLVATPNEASAFLLSTISFLFPSVCGNVRRDEGEEQRDENDNDDDDDVRDDGNHSQPENDDSGPTSMPVAPLVPSSSPLPGVTESHVSGEVGDPMEVESRAQSTPFQAC